MQEKRSIGNMGELGMFHQHMCRVSRTCRTNTHRVCTCTYRVSVDTRRFRIYIYRTTQASERALISDPMSRKWREMHAPIPLKVHRQPCLTTLNSSLRIICSHDFSIRILTSILGHISHRFKNKDFLTKVVLFCHTIPTV